MVFYYHSSENDDGQWEKSGIFIDNNKIQNHFNLTFKNSSIYYCC